MSRLPPWADDEHGPTSMIPYRLHVTRTININIVQLLLESGADITSDLVAPCVERGILIITAVST
jgi:hypothetical protein